MSGSYGVVGMFAVGCLAGAVAVAAGFDVPDVHGISVYILYALMLQVGLGLGSRDNLKPVLRAVGPKVLLLPAASVAGTLAFSALAGLLLSRWSVADYLAVCSGMGYYSLSSVLIMQLKMPTLGAQLATELATIALLTNIMRELLALLLAPALSRFCGRMAPISAAGVTSADVALPSIMRASGQAMVPFELIHGLLIDCSVPFFVTFFCKL